MSVTFGHAAPLALAPKFGAFTQFNISKTFYNLKQPEYLGDLQDIPDSNHVLVAFGDGTNSDENSYRIIVTNVPQSAVNQKQGILNTRWHRSITIKPNELYEHDTFVKIRDAVEQVKA